MLVLLQRCQNTNHQNVIRTIRTWIGEHLVTSNVSGLYLDSTGSKRAVVLMSTEETT